MEKKGADEGESVQIRRCEMKELGVVASGCLGDSGAGAGCWHRRWGLAQHWLGLGWSMDPIPSSTAPALEHWSIGGVLESRRDIHLLRNSPGIAFFEIDAGGEVTSMENRCHLAL